MAKVVAARTGLSQADAEKRVNDVVTQVKADLDAARKAAMQIAIWLTLSLFIGAFSASLAATEGGGLRDGTWGKKAYGNHRDQSLTLENERRDTMPILLWLVGIPIPLIILIMLLPLSTMQSRNVSSTRSNQWRNT